MTLDILLDTEQRRIRLAATLTLPVIILDALDADTEATPLTDTVQAILGMLSARAGTLAHVAAWLGADGPALLRALEAAGVGVQPATRRWLLDPARRARRRRWAGLVDQLVTHPVFGERLEAIAAE